MTRLCAVFVIVTTGCMASGSAGYGVGTRSSGPRSVPPPSGPAPVAHGGGSYAPGEDLHWFSADDYLVGPGQPETGQRLKVAKMLEPPTAATNGEARFLVSDGRELWTANFHKTRVLGPGDMAVNVRAFCLNDAAYRTATEGPRNKTDARNGWWTMAAITDTNDSYKGRIQVGRLACPIAATRVLAR